MGRSLPTDYRDEASLRTLFEEAGLRDVETTRIEVSVEYETVDELWEPAIHVGGPGRSRGGRRSRRSSSPQGRAIFEEALGQPDRPLLAQGPRGGRARHQRLRTAARSAPVPTSVTSTSSSRSTNST